ncbi:Uncharacterised protein [Nocardia brasiliensis]|nr:Uncharacterised protein [Nocardia brasiliensis]
MAGVRRVPGSCGRCLFELTSSCGTGGVRGWCSPCPRVVRPLPIRADVGSWDGGRPWLVSAASPGSCGRCPVAHRAQRRVAPVARPPPIRPYVELWNVGRPWPGVRRPPGSCGRCPVAHRTQRRVAPVARPPPIRPYVESWNEGMPAASRPPRPQLCVRRPVGQLRTPQLRPVGSRGHGLPCAAQAVSSHERGAEEWVFATRRPTRPAREVRGRPPHRVRRAPSRVAAALASVALPSRDHLAPAAPACPARAGGEVFMKGLAEQGFSRPDGPPARRRVVERGCPSPRARRAPCRGRRPQPRAATAVPSTPDTTERPPGPNQATDSPPPPFTHPFRVHAPAVPRHSGCVNTEPVREHRTRA